MDDMRFQMPEAQVTRVTCVQRQEEWKAMVSATRRVAYGVSDQERWIPVQLSKLPQGHNITLETGHIHLLCMICSVNLLFSGFRH